MSEWKKLDPSNLPNDILVGDYEIKYDGNHTGWFGKCGIFDILEDARDEMAHFVYRKREHKAPSHTEIMTKWWLNGEMWVKVAGYKNGIYWIFDKISDEDSNEFTAVRKKWFNELESADIPPEETK